jgi:hypothetical protein
VAAKEDTLRKVAEAVPQQFQPESCVADVQRRLTALREKWRRVERIKSLGLSIRDEDYQQCAMVMTKCPLSFRFTSSKCGSY